MSYLTAIRLTPGGSSTVQYSTIQYTFSHKYYIEQHNETEYTERNMYNTKNIKLTKEHVK
jgi:hypothetical protein